MLAYSGPLGNAPTISAALAAGPGATMWILSSMSTGLAVSLLTAGALADQSGRRRVFEIGAVIFVGGSIVCATSTTATQFIAGRLIEGLGAAGLIATGLGLVAAVRGDLRARSLTASWWGAAMGLGIALGPLLTGLLDLAHLWRAAYWLLALISAGVGLAARRCFPETAVVPGRRMDLFGATTMTIAVAGLLVALVESRGGSSAVAVACAVASVIALGVFIASQLTIAAPMMDLTLFRRPDFVAATGAAAVTGIGVIALMSFACTFLVTTLAMSTFGAGALLALWSGTSAVAAVLSRGLTVRISGTLQLVIGLAGTGIGLLLMTHLSAGSSFTRLIPGLVVAGIGGGILNAGLGRQAIATVPPERAAVGVGMNNTTRYIGSSVGVTVVGVLASAPHHDIAAQLSGWNVVTVLTGAISLAGAAAVLILHRRSSGAVVG